MPNKMYGYSEEKSWQRSPIKNEGQILGGIYTSPRKGDVDSPPSMGVFHHQFSYEKGVHPCRRRLINRRTTPYYHTPHTTLTKSTLTKQ